jgi:hypothetical protein
LVAFALLVCPTTWGCTSSPQQKVTIHDSQDGTVYLERIPNDSLQATHPITLDSGTIARTLRGIRVRDSRKTMQTFLSSVFSPSTPVRAFSDEEADFLAPFIASAFAKATPDQRVGFRITRTGTSTDSQKGGAGPDSTSGFLFVYGRSLQLTLTRLPPIRDQAAANTPSRHYASDATGLSGRELVFLPKEAQRPDTFRVGDTDAPTLVIDYELLAKLPDQPAAAAVPAAAPAGAPPSAPAVTAPQTTGELEAVKESLAKKDAEVEALKKEVNAIKKQLNEQQKPAQPKPKNKPAAKPAQ